MMVDRVTSVRNERKLGDRWERGTPGWGRVCIRWSEKTSPVMGDFSSDLNYENVPDRQKAWAEGMNTQCKGPEAGRCNKWEGSERRYERKAGVHSFIQSIFITEHLLCAEQYPRHYEYSTEENQVLNLPFILMCRAGERQGTNTSNTGQVWSGVVYNIIFKWGES